MQSVSKSVFLKILHTTNLSQMVIFELLFTARVQKHSTFQHTVFSDKNLQGIYQDFMLKQFKVNVDDQGSNVLSIDLSI